VKPLGAKKDSPRLAVCECSRMRSLSFSRAQIVPGAADTSLGKAVRSEQIIGLKGSVRYTHFPESTSIGQLMED